MAASAGPRPGWSRRAQYSLFFSFLAVVGGLLAGLIMLILSLVAPQSYAVVRGAALDVTAPISGALSEVTTTVTGLVGGAGDYWNAANQNGQLKRERAALMRRMVEARAILEENQQLKAALQLRERTEQAVAAGRVVGSSFESPRRFAVISVGSSDGVKIGMPVRAPEGLIGRVIESGMLASRVLLVTDRANIVPARILRGGQPVISTGRGDGTIDVRPLEVGKNPFKPGDVIITSGTGGLYPPLVPIAKVIRLDDDGAIAVPIADPARVSFAIVVPPYEPAALEVASRPDSGTL
ncbi:rod shape-determining protein MreC [Sphingomonas edaphi]|uniref:Cell shape-determining protein MreC n=1 Tax=Sphingomonas edaphi TaxID=2315689 RepID=A0A418Q124_9SPHN|nr:rod shape-determining protein MreC [Sphingomonas edaphi]RIX31513.1 rod shape-determining protein MreC [Sphingomonas edaphi]